MSRQNTLLFVIASSCIFHHTLSCCIYPYETPVVKYLKYFEITEHQSGLASVDCIYVVNLDERPEKWDRTYESLCAFHLTANRFSAINGWKFSEETMSELGGPYQRRWITKGGLGCLLSHVSILKNAYDHAFNLIWILEDDEEFIEDVHQLPALLAKLTHIDPEWDLFYTDSDFRGEENGHIRSLSSDFRPDAYHHPLSHYLKRTAVDEDIVKIGQRFGTRSFFVSRKGIEKILHYFTHVYVWTTIDIDLHYIPGIREYCSKRDIVSNQRKRSYIDTLKPFN